MAKKKILSLFISLLLTLSFTIPVYAAINLDTNVGADGIVNIEGNSIYKEAPVNILIEKGETKAYFDQGQTDNKGNFHFNFKLDPGQEYTGKIKVLDEREEFLLLINTQPTEKGLVTVRVEGKSQTLLEPTEVEIMQGETTILKAIQMALEQKGIEYKIHKNIMHTIAGEQGWEWMINYKGGMYPSEHLIKDHDDIILIDAELMDPVITRLLSHQTEVKVGEKFTVTLEQFNGSEFVPLAGKSVKAGNQTQETNEKGQVVFTAQNPGEFTISCEPAENYIRPVPAIITVTEATQFEVKVLDTPDYFNLGKDADVTAEATNNSDQAQDVLLIIALYDDQKMMLNYSYSAKNVAPNTTEQLTSGFRIPAEGNYQVKAFVWENWGSIKPLSNVSVIPVQ